MNNALKGDPKATDRVVKLLREAGLTDELDEALTTLTMRELSEEDRAILDRFGKRGNEAKAAKEE